MSAPVRMLVAACSSTKNDPGWQERRPDGSGRRNRVSLVDLYAGPAWRQIRKHYAAGGMLNDGVSEVWALSARHGLCPAYTLSEVYNARLERESDARQLADQWRRGADSSRHFANVLAGIQRRRFGYSASTGEPLEGAELVFFGGRLYRLALERYLEHVVRHHGVTVTCEAFSGGIIQQLGQLRAWFAAGESR